MKTIWFFYPYGPLPSENTLEFRYIRFSRELAKYGFKCVWWTANFNHGTKSYRAEDWKLIEVSDNISVFLVPSTSYKKNISVGRIFFEVNYARNLGKRIKAEEKPDLIITSGTGMITAFRPCWPYMEKNNIPVIYDIMDVHMLDTYMDQHHKGIAPFIKLVMGLIHKKEANFYHHVSGVTALGRGQLEIARKRTGNRKIPTALLYNSIYVEPFRQEMHKPCIISIPEKKEHTIWCIYAGALGPSNDIKAVIDCAEMCKRNGDNVSFIIAGRGEYTELVEKKARENENIIYLGKVPQRTLIPVYAKCDVGLATYAEYSTVDMPDKFYDYTAAGLAIINSLRGEIGDHVLHDCLGFNYEPENASSLYNAIKRLTDPETLKHCKANSLKTGNDYDFGKRAKDLVSICKRITEGDSL